MSKYLIQKFIKSTDYNNPQVRETAGVLSSWVGIACNLTLFGVKLLVGILTNSVSILSDSFNNLTDMISNIATIFGYKASSKPADKEHPFGHGRVETLTAMFIAVVILLLGFELLKSSVNEVINPSGVVYSHVALVILVLSIFLKFWLNLFNRKLAGLYHSEVFKAVAQDSLNDCIVTSFTVIALICSLFTDLPIDGISGCLVSIFVMKSGISILLSTVDELLGKPIDEETLQKIKEIVVSKDKLIGVHDIIIHNYGPAVKIGSCHVEVDKNSGLVEIHDKLDEIEREIYEKFHIVMTCHADPIDINDEETIKMFNIIKEIVKQIDNEMDIHDLRIVKEKGLRRLIFDVDVPFNVKLTNKQIKTFIDKKLKENDCTYSTVISYDRGYIEE